MTRTWRAVAAALCFAALGMGGAVQAEPIRLGYADMQKVTFLLLRQGRSAQALAFANAMLAQRPDDSTVLALKSRAERDLGRNPAAIATARQSWRAAKTGPERFTASMVMAQGLASDQQKFRAQFWLRRAMQEAPTPQARKSAENDFGYVRRRSRLSVQIDTSVQPNSNVNNGSSATTIYFLGLPFVLSGGSRALSGIEASATVTLRYRIAENPTGKTDLRFSALDKQVFLSSAAKALAPNARNGDYAFAATEIGLDRKWLFAKGRAEGNASVTLGHNWYGGEDLSHYYRFSGGATVALARGWQGFALGQIERQDRLDDARQSANLHTLSLGVSHVLSNHDRLRLTLSGTEAQSQSSAVDHSAVSASLDWALARPVLGSRLNLGLVAEQRDYDQSLYSSAGRHDRLLAASAAFALEKLDYMGFIPVLSVEASRTESNISLYQGNSLGLGLSIQSKF
jgi:hypothetical protein